MPGLYIYGRWPTGLDRNSRIHARQVRVQVATRLCRRRIFFLRVASRKKAKDFFADELRTRASTGKPRKPSSPPGLVYRHKKGTSESQEKKETKEGEKVAPAKATFRVS